MNTKGIGPTYVDKYERVGIRMGEFIDEELFKEIDTLYDCISKQQRNVFDMMCAQGWYKMTADSEKNISKAYTKFSNSESELS